MTMQLFGHPFSSYTQKVTIALYETGAPFAARTLTPDDSATALEFAKLWPIKKFPILLDGEQTLFESSVIIEHLANRYGRTDALVPKEPDAANAVRMLDRFFDNYIMTPTQKIVGDRLRPEGWQDPRGVQDARSLLSTAYAWLDDALAHRVWAAGDEFTMADCAAAPALFYADWVHDIEPSCAHLRAYRQRLLSRPSVARVVDEARAFRPLFPGGAPQRD